MFCKFCGNEIDEDVVVCPKCGKQVKELKVEKSNSASLESSINFGGFGDLTKPKYKLVSILLCCIGFFGIGGIHKFYEGKTGMGVLYLLTAGLLGIGTIIDLVNLVQVKGETYTVN
nr:MAG TPA: TM2 domain [Caudoviricetes sp.]